jgi:hypothetical protein
VRYRPLVLAAQHKETSELGVEGRQVCVGLACFEGSDCRFEPGNRLLRVALVEVDIGQAGRDACGRMRLSGCDEDIVRLFEERSCFPGPPGAPRRLPGAQAELGPGELVVRQAGGLLEVTLRLGRRSQRHRPLAGAHERIAGLYPQLACIGGVGSRLVRGEQM